MANEAIIITLGKELPERTRAATINGRLLLVHKVVALTIFIVFLYLGIKDQSLVEHYRRMGLLCYVAGVFASFFGSHVFAAFAMWIPSFIFARIVPPQIWLLDDYMIYFGGSVAKHYEGRAQFFSFFKYLLGIEQSQVIARRDIDSVDLERGNLSRFMGWGEWIAIAHKNGRLLTGVSLTDSFKVEVVKEIEAWLKKGKT